MTTRPLRDYSSIRDDIVRCYQETGNVCKVARLFRVSSCTVSKICKEAGVFIKRKAGKKKAVIRHRQLQILQALLKSVRHLWLLPHTQTIGNCYRYRTLLHQMNVKYAALPAQPVINP